MKQNRSIQIMKNLLKKRLLFIVIPCLLLGCGKETSLVSGISNQSRNVTNRPNTSSQNLNLEAIRKALGRTCFQHFLDNGQTQGGTVVWARGLPNAQAVTPPQTHFKPIVILTLYRDFIVRKDGSTKRHDFFGFAFLQTPNTLALAKEFNQIRPTKEGCFAVRPQAGAIVPNVGRADILVAAFKD